MSAHSLSTELKTAIFDAHHRIEGTRLARQLLAGTVDRASYVALLTSWSRIDAALAARLAIDGCAPVPRELVLRSELLADDLRAVHAEPVVAGSACVGLCRQIGMTVPDGLIGMAYVVLGSRLGAAVLRPRLQQALGLPGEEGTRFHAAIPRADWLATLAALDAHACGPAARSRMLAGANAMMDGLLHVYEEISGA